MFFFFLFLFLSAFLYNIFPDESNLKKNLITFDRDAKIKGINSILYLTEKNLYNIFIFILKELLNFLK